MSQRQYTLGHNLIFFILYFSIHNRAVSSELLQPVSSDKEYTISFLNTVDTQNIFLQKCCNLSEVLNKDGICIPTPQDFKPIVPLSLEKRIKREIQKSPLFSDENEGFGLNQDAFVLRFNFQRPACNEGTLRRLSYNSTGAIKLTSSLQFVTSNILEGIKPGSQSLIVDTKNYCIEYRESEEGIVVEFCVPKDLRKMVDVRKGLGEPYDDDPTYSRTSSSPVLLRKCCQPSHVINMATFACVRHDIPWQLYPLQLRNVINPLDYQSMENSDTLANISENSGNNEDETRRLPLHVSWLTGRPNCKEPYDVYTDEYDRYYINSEGLLITEQNGTVAKTPKTEYCIDAVIFSLTNNLNSSATNNADKNITSRDEQFNNIFSQQMALVCFENNMEEKDKKFSWRSLYAVLTGISSIFLLITCLIYVLLRKELKLPGWLQFAYSLSLLLTFTLLTVAQQWTQAIHDISKSLCRALGYGLHFSFLVCFFYLTSMNFEIFTSFRSITLAHGFGKSRGKRRFLEFTAFSIGFPTAITALLLAVDSCNPDDKNLQGYLCILPTTGIGVESCVFDSRHRMAQLQYFYGFVGILLMINLVIFVCTLVSLRNRERETRMAKRQSTSTCDYDRLQLFTRLFLIMGILWTFEVISWLFQYFEVDENVQDIFIVTDCLNASQGFAVFLMFIWKRKTWKHLKKKFKTSFGIHKSRPLCRPNGTISSANTTNGTSVKSSHLSSTESRDSMRLPVTSISTVTAVGTFEIAEPLKSET